MVRDKANALQIRAALQLGRTLALSLWLLNALHTCLAYSLFGCETISGIQMTGNALNSETEVGHMIGVLLHAP
ncbi:uncharacterized protein BKA55DRAFT_573368 [Fusarium redolens]|jgi:hypothetical protein|uniref:Uncharacterized protein n=1 Tax=Fusarium redolens TaxID=48865 RepID=A0A9P9K4S3_FUSRE|nr:uncharacterized protein BKA55DRAFT_573368 [Fusarium redolens]KAH7244211.1 hypothetical protein BKA55DRAFT_573368 [Fusarium redolens]